MAACLASRLLYLAPFTVLRGKIPGTIANPNCIPEARFSLQRCLSASVLFSDVLDLSLPMTCITSAASAYFPNTK